MLELYDVSILAWVTNAVDSAIPQDMIRGTRRLTHTNQSLTIKPMMKESAVRIPQLAKSFKLPSS